LFKFFRLIYIQWIFARYGLDKLIVSLPLFSSIRFIPYLNPFNWWRRKDYERGEAIRLALQELGPIFVKFGQALSTRRDLLPDDISDELAMLQDKVPPFSGQLAQTIVEQTLNQPIDDLFQSFDNTPLASASIAQVHAATLHDGTEVVVKILRPNIHKNIKRDVSLMVAVAKFIHRAFPEARRLRPMDVVREFDKTIHDELDYKEEE